MNDRRETIRATEPEDSGTIVLEYDGSITVKPPSKSSRPSGLLALFAALRDAHRYVNNRRNAT